MDIFVCGNGRLIDSTMAGVRMSSTARAMANPRGEFRIRDEQRMRFLAKRLKQEARLSQRWSPDKILRMLKQRLSESYPDTRRAFRAVDKNNTGTLCRDELRQALDLFNVSPRQEDFDELWDSLDADKSGTISMLEFSTVIGELQGKWGPAFQANDNDASTSLTMPDNLALLKEAHMKVPELGRITPAQVINEMRHRMIRFSRVDDIFRPFDSDDDGLLTEDELRQCLLEKFCIECRDDDFAKFVVELTGGQHSTPTKIDYGRLIDTLGKKSTGSFDYTRGADAYRDHVESLYQPFKSNPWPEMRQCGHMGAFVGSLATTMAERRKHENQMVPKVHYVSAREAAVMLREKFAASPNRVYKIFRHAEKHMNNAATRRDLQALLVDLTVFVTPLDFERLLAMVGTRPRDGCVRFSDFFRVFGQDVINKTPCKGIDWGVSTVSNEDALNLGFAEVEDKYYAVDSNCEKVTEKNSFYVAATSDNDEEKTILRDRSIPTLPRDDSHTFRCVDESSQTPNGILQEDFGRTDVDIYSPSPQRHDVNETSLAVEEQYVPVTSIASPSPPRRERPKTSGGGGRCNQVSRRHSEKTCRRTTAVATAPVAPTSRRLEQRKIRPKSAVPLQRRRSAQIKQLKFGENVASRDQQRNKEKSSHMLIYKQKLLLHNDKAPRRVPPPKPPSAHPINGEEIWWGTIGRELWQPNWAMN